MMLMRHLERVRRDKAQGESIIAPRPQRFSMGSIYYGLVVLHENSRLHSYFSQLGKVEYLNKEQYDHEIAKVEAYWEA